ncbi:trihelix transcription factor ASIL1-like [Senna tora]|uniref:Trihelix transcription factor ASIL1-like n=1 Tax=Senna tora TaxID=362788 RepID=A0A834XAX8_9FABA|nr:trihelix transcription factor ASIL1-like [Senna tora]
MAELQESLTPPSANHRPMPVREDCWSEEATSTLVDAWGRRFLELNKGNLRQKDWQDVADAVNALHGLTKKTHRTDVQCKNRIDTIKKKYKVEKSRVLNSNGAFSSSWPFFDRLDSLIGSTFNAKKSSPSPPVALPLPYRKTQSPLTAVPASVALPQKRSAAMGLDDGYFRRNYSAVAAAAAAAEADEDEDEVEEEDEEDEERGSEVEEGEREKEGMRRLAKAIERFGEMYERVEREKLRQMVDLEKQRMQFTKDLEVQRMQMFMDTQVQLERIKRGKRSGSNVMKSDDGGFWKIGKLFRKKKEKDRDCGRSVNGGGFDVFKIGLEHMGLGRLLPVDAGVGDGRGLRGEVGARAGDDGPRREVVEGVP